MKLRRRWVRPTRARARARNRAAFPHTAARLEPESCATRMQARATLPLGAVPEPVFERLEAELQESARPAAALEAIAPFAIEREFAI